MSRRGGRTSRGGCGRSGGAYQGRGGRGQGNYYSGVRAAVKHKGLCAALSNHVFYYGQKGAADQMRTTREKIVHHVGTIYHHDISNELHNKKTVITRKPRHTQDVLDKHAERVTRHESQELRLSNARQDQEQR
jgi:hypothetical protein